MHIAHKAALLSSFRQRVGAAVIRNGRVLGVGCNSIRHKKGHFLKKWDCSLHAEQAAILSVLGSCKKASLYVCRVKKDGSLGNACPCPVCREMIISSGIKEVFYSNEYGDIVRWKPQL